MAATGLEGRPVGTGLKHHSLCTSRTLSARTRPAVGQPNNICGRSTQSCRKLPFFSLVTNIFGCNLESNRQFSNYGGLVVFGVASSTKVPNHHHRSVSVCECIA